MHWLSILVTSLKGMMPPLYRQQGSLFRWVGAFCVREVDYIVLLSDIGVTYLFHSPHFIWPCLPWPSSMIGCIPLGVHYPLASMGIDIIPSALCTCSFRGLQPHHITWGLHLSSVDALVDVHGRSCNFPFFHPREALLIGCQVTALPLSSCGILFFFTSYRGSLAWGGAGTPVPCMTPVHTQGNANFWHNKKSVSVEDSWPSALVCHFVRGDISRDLTHHLPNLFFTPIFDLPLSLKTICLH